MKQRIPTKKTKRKAGSVAANHQENDDEHASKKSHAVQDLGAVMDQDMVHINEYFELHYSSNEISNLSFNCENNEQDNEDFWNALTHVVPPNREIM